MTDRTTSRPITKTWITCPATPVSIVAGCTTRYGGSSTGPYAENNLALHVDDDPLMVLDNRRRLQSQLDATGIQWLQQVHGNECIYATAHDGAVDGADPAPVADAVWTDQAGLALAIMTADCVPVLVWDSGGCVVGAAHAGWQGLRCGVLDVLIERLPAPAGDLHAWIGPCISQRYYEVGEEVWSHFVDYGPALVAIHPQQRQKRLLDLPRIAQRQLVASGLQRVMLSGLCSYQDGRFYSHRRSRGEFTGRMASIIMRR